jgi:hypothetical protein
MTAAQLEAIYKANIGTGHLEALEAVYTHGYCSGAGITPTAMQISQAKIDPAPTTTILIKRPDLR